jgi:hypothetical protein
MLKGNRRPPLARQRHAIQNMPVLNVYLVWMLLSLAQMKPKHKHKKIFFTDTGLAAHLLGRVMGRW